MLLADIVRRHPLWLGALLGAVIGTVIGLFLPIRAPLATPAQDADWRLPALAATRAYTEAAAAGARGASFWGDQAQPRRNAQSTWTLRAITTRPTPKIALAVSGRGDIVWVGLGEALPDGSVLVALDRDTAWTERDGCRSPRNLYPMPTDVASDPCARPGATPPAAAPRSASTLPQTQKTDTP